MLHLRLENSARGWASHPPSTLSAERLSVQKGAGVGQAFRRTHADSAHKSEPQVTFCDQRKGFLHKTKPPVTFCA